MQDLDESAQAIAGVYARALFDLAIERDQETQIARQLEECCAYMDRDPAFGDFLTSDAIDNDRRSRSLEKMFRGKLSDTLLDTLQVMNGKGRLGLIRALHEQFTHIRHAGHNEVEVVVTTAVPLERSERKALIEELRRTTGKDIVLEERVSESIVGGLIVHIGDRLMDASVATRLKHMRRQLQARAGEEIHSGKEYFVQT